jgi:hypothetical protein
MHCMVNGLILNMGLVTVLSNADHDHLLSYQQDEIVPGTGCSNLFHVNLFHAYNAQAGTGQPWTGTSLTVQVGIS